MKPEEMILDSILNYPLLFHSRLSVLSHQLTFLGNGCSWGSNGELQSSEIEEIKNITVEEKIKNALKKAKKVNDTRFKDTYRTIKKVDEECYKALKRMFDETIEEQVYKTIKNAKEISISLDYDLNDITEYPICGESIICCIPENITDEWLDVCIEFCSLAKLVYEKDFFEKKHKSLLDIKAKRIGVNI